MKGGRLGHLGGLLAKDLAVLAGRPGLWAGRTFVVALLLAGIEAAWLARGGGAHDLTELTELGRTIAVTLSICAYVATLFAGPAITAGAIEDERASGMLEILGATPLSEGRIIASIVLSRLIAAGHFLVAALPLFAVPLFLGGVAPVDVIFGGLALIALGSLLTTSYALWLAAQGRRPKEVLRGVAIFVLLTPFAPGVLPFGWAALSLLLALSPLLIVVLPLWGAALLMAWAGPEAYFLLPIPMALFSAGSFVFLHLARRSLPGWRSRIRPDSAAERFRYGEGWHRERRGALSSLVGGEKAVEDGTPEPAPAPLPSMARTILGRLRGLEGRLYRWTRGNPFVVREILRARTYREREVDLIGSILSRIGLPALILLALFVGLGALYRPVEVGEISLWVCLFTGGGLFMAGGIACGTASRLIPPRTQRGLLETLWSSPLRAGDAAIGALAVTALRTKVVAAVVSLTVLGVGILSLRPLWSVACLLLFYALVALCHAAASWIRLLVPRPGEAAAAAFALLAVLGIGSALLAPSSWVLSSLHPLRALFDRGRGAELCIACAALVTGLLAAALIAAFVASFDRILGRPRDAGRPT